jgi:hypothetical protein
MEEVEAKVAIGNLDSVPPWLVHRHPYQECSKYYALSGKLQKTPIQEQTSKKVLAISITTFNSFSQDKHSILIPPFTASSWKETNKIHISTLAHIWIGKTKQRLRIGINNLLTQITNKWCRQKCQTGIRHRFQRIRNVSYLHGTTINYPLVP